MIAIIAAVSANNVIGRGGRMPWYLPEDLKHFKKLTTGHTVIMGRKTFESILNFRGSPLPNRRNIVITRQRNYQVPEGVLVFHNVTEAIGKYRGENLFIIGGGEIFKVAMDFADQLFITKVHETIDGDVFFPEIDPKRWKEVKREDDQKFSFVTYQPRSQK